MKKQFDKHILCGIVLALTGQYGITWQQKTRRRKNMIENIEQARIEFAGIFNFVCPSKRKIKEYIRANEELVVVFEAKRHLPKLAMQARLRIQAATEHLDKNK